MPRALSAEFALLVACCRWPLSADAREDVVRRSEAADWTRFVRLARRHRVEGIAWKALQEADVASRLPAGPAADLSAATHAIARQNLSLAAEAIQIGRRLDGEGIAHLFVKGVALGKLIYGDIGRKAGWDIDLLVDLPDLDAAAAILRAKGYTLDTPAPDTSPEGLAVWHRHAKESVWRSADGRYWVELHTALTDNPLLLPGMDARAGRQTVELSPGMALPTLAGDELFAYLCVHGASSAWFRLKWIADLAALVGDAPAAEVERLYRRSVELGAGRAPAVALLLADRLFRPNLSEALRRELRADPVNRWIVAISMRKLAGRAGEAELDEVAMGTASIHVAQFGLLPGWRFKCAELARQLVSPVDRIAVPLPAALTWLYPFVQLSRVVRRKSA